MTSEDFLDALLKLPDWRAAKVSPDGKWVAWSWTGLGPAADVFAVPADGSAAPTRLTQTADNTQLVSWTPDGQGVIVAQDHNGNERLQLFRVDLTRPLHLEPLTEANPNYYVRGGQLHPNRRWLVYAANLDAQTGQEIEASWLYRHDLETGERVVLAQPRQGCYYQPQLNNRGSHILYSRNDLHPSGRQVWLADIEGGEDREILNFGPEVKVTATWLPDDGYRAVVLAEAANYRRVGLWNLNGGQTEWLVDDPRRNIEYAFVPPGSRHLVIAEVSQAQTRASLFDLESRVETPLPGIAGNLVPLAPLNRQEWIGRYYSSRQPADLVRFTLDRVTPEAFTSLTRVWEQTSLRPDDLVAAEQIQWNSVDGLTIQGWLYRTNGEARGTVVLVHGGPTSFVEDSLNSEVQFLVSEGFNVLLPNYRGSTGFSLSFQESIKEDGWGGREQDDIRAGIETLINARIAEQGKVGVTGTSYGGYSAWCAITRWPVEVVAAAAPVCGMTDLVVDYETTRPDLRPLSEAMLGGRPDQLPQKYFERSPVNFVSNIKGRLLIVQGLQDPNVTPENVYRVARALEQAGITYETLNFEDEGHGISRPANRKTLYRRLVRFFEEAFNGAKGS